MNRKPINDFETVEELDRWAAMNDLSTDEEVNLRRIALLADRINPVVSNQVPHKCNVCEKQFKQKRHLQRHKRTVHSQSNSFQCKHCDMNFNRKDNFSRHMKCHKEKVPIPANGKRLAEEQVDTSNAKRSKTDTETFPLQKCNWCMQMKSLLPGKKFCSTCNEQGRECYSCHRPLPERFYGLKTDVCDTCINRREAAKSRNQSGGSISALNGTAQTEILEPNPGNIWDVLQFFMDNQEQIKDILEDRMKTFKGLKWFITLFVKFVKYNDQNEAIYAEPVFRSFNFACTNSSQIEKQLAEAFRGLHNAYQNFERDGSGWSIDKILKLEVSTVEYVPLQGSSYIPLPPKIQAKKAVLNIKNNDQKCFLWSVLASKYHVTWRDNAERVSNYKQYEAELNVDGIDFPIPLSQISKFEQQNMISVNVFGLEKEDVYPLHITDQRDMTKHVNLLLFSKGEQRHYCLIRNLSRLLGDRTAHDGQTYYCNHCLHGFTTQQILEEHIPYCSPHGPQKLSFPKREEQQWLSFNSINKQLRVPFVIYADMESIVRPISSCDSDPNKSSTTKYQKHEPSGFCYTIKCSNDELSKPARVYRGPNIIDHFFDCLLEEEKYITDILEKVHPMKLTSEEERAFQKATKCHICDKELGADRVRDHDHLSGKFRGAAHSNCNFQFQFRKGKSSERSKFYIPVVFHNLKGYDMHLLMESAGKYKNKTLSCIPNNMEKYISFSMGNLRFIDSIQFLNASLDTLVNNVAEDGISKFKTLAKHFCKDEELNLLLRKGVYPYDYVTSHEKFTETSLPPKEMFYNKLNDSNISDKDYDHASTVWRTFKMTNFGEYHDLYLKTDVLLLADVFENFRDISMQHYGLDPAHYYSSPGLSWDAMLKMTGVELQLLNEIDMVLMVEKGMRGGISMISKKYARANNPEVVGYDPSQPKTWLTYLDMNNLYGTAMSEALPEKDFYWLNENEIDQLDFQSISDDAETGYIVECDLDYPENLHDDHNDYPLAPEAMTVTKDMLSQHTKGLRKSLGLKGKPGTKLVPNLGPKKNYVTHYRNLKYYLSHGLKVTKIHRVLGFMQSAWLKPYIDFNTEQRKQAKNSFEKDFWKLLVNSIFGKSCENLRKRISVELVNTPKRLRKVCAKPNFQSFKIFNEDLVAVHMKKINIILNRPMYVGFSILDVSKVFMYQFHYDFMKQKYGDRAQVLYTDTDSLIYSVETDDWYSDMADNLDRYDTSNFKKDNPLYSSKNCKVLGKMKDECGGLVVEECIFLKPKMYSVKCGGIEKKTAKGVKKCVIEKQLKHEAYRHCLEMKCSLRHKMNMIRSFNHQLYSLTVNKTSLSPYDDKRYFTGIESLAYGHYKIIK